MAAGVLGLALATSITTLQRSFLSLDSARNIETACRIMQCELEKERLFTWTHVSDLAYVPAIDSALLADPAVAGRFSLSRSVLTLADHSGRLLQITVTVSWRNYDGRTLQRSLSTYFGNNGLTSFLNPQI